MLIRNWGFIIVQVLVVVLWQSAPSLPNLIGISFETAIVVLPTVAGIVAGLLGIFIAVLILAFERASSTFPTYSVRIIFRNPYSVRILTLSVLSLLISLGTIPPMRTPLDEESISRGQVALAYFAFVLLFFIYYLWALLTRASVHSYIEELVHQIPWGEAELFTLGRTPGPAEEWELARTQPWRVLVEAGTRSIRQQDHLTARHILLTLKTQLLEHLHRFPEADARSRINTFVRLARPLAEEARRADGAGVLYQLMTDIGDVYEMSASLKMEWAALIEFNEFVQEELKALVNLKQFKAALEAGIRSVGRAAEKNLALKVPPEEELLILQHQWGKHPAIKDGAKPRRGPSMDALIRNVRRYSCGRGAASYQDEPRGSRLERVICPLRNRVSGNESSTPRGTAKERCSLEGLLAASSAGSRSRGLKFLARLLAVRVQLALYHGTGKAGGCDC
ncbi:MAG: hypothetical protein ACE15E_24370 [Acidobacteriota bacterium]